MFFVFFTKNIFNCSCRVFPPRFLFHFFSAGAALTLAEGAAVTAAEAETVGAADGAASAVTVAEADASEAAGSFAGQPATKQATIESNAKFFIFFSIICNQM